MKRDRESCDIDYGVSVYLNSQTWQESKEINHVEHLSRERGDAGPSDWRFKVGDWMSH